MNVEVIFKNKCMSYHGGNLEGGAGPDPRHVGVSMCEEEILNQIVNGGGCMPGGLVDKDRPNYWQNGCLRRSIYIEKRQPEYTDSGCLWDFKECVSPGLSFFAAF